MKYNCVLEQQGFTVLPESPCKFTGLNKSINVCKLSSLQLLNNCTVRTMTITMTR